MFLPYVYSSLPYKLLIPLNQCGLYIVGTRQEPLMNYIDEAVALIKVWSAY